MPKRSATEATATPFRKTLVGAFLALQLGVPLGYYVWRSNDYDERFAWRMFSPTRMIQCRAQFFGSEAGEQQAEPLRLSREISEPWIRWIERGHVRVARAFGRHWCQTHGRDASLRATLSCTAPTGEQNELLSPSEELCAN